MKKVLIANRSEIARRIIRTLKKMNIKSVAIYSDVDREAPHVIEADEAYHVGPAPASESYLKGDKIITIALESGCDAIHPGYGFLSENASFAKACRAEGLIFIGPSEEAITLMGSKIASKQKLSSYEVPMVPGTDRAIQNLEEAQEIAQNIGYPILVKASAGGGGKGMRIVEKEEDLESQISMARSEALASFGDEDIFIEKFVLKPRHIEIQILADEHGNIVHLYERECSLQRRHQKVIEEAPSAVLTPELRDKMGAAAIEVARACNYTGAGTVEFLFDANQNFYFLEMNTRLQVEHPVTECITGLDLVAEQVRIARGEKLSDAVMNAPLMGHAIELRVYAEDSMNDFTPSIGTLTAYEEPNPSVARTDSGLRWGMEIPVHYDPMISKLIVHAPTRDEAIAKMKLAIEQYTIEGCHTTLDFGRFAMNHEKFIEGDFDTSFIQRYFSKERYKELFQDDYAAAALFAAYLESK